MNLHDYSIIFAQTCNLEKGDVVYVEVYTTSHKQLLFCGVTQIADVTTRSSSYDGSFLGYTFDVYRGFQGLGGDHVTSTISVGTPMFTDDVIIPLGNFYSYEKHGLMELLKKYDARNC